MSKLRQSTQSNSQTKNAYFFWLAWQSEKVEQFLEDQAQKGWQLERVEGFFYRFCFKNTGGQRVRFALDCQRKPEPAYFEGNQAKGWVLVHQQGSWLLWRKLYAGKRPDFESDSRALLSRNDRMMQVIVALMVLNFPLFSWVQRTVGQQEGFLISFGMGVYTLVVVLLFLDLVKLLQLNKRIKKELKVKGGAK